MGQLVIRWADLGDCRDLGRVHSEAYRSAYKGIIPDHYLMRVTADTRETYYRETLGNGCEKIAILMENQAAAGVLVVGECRDDDLDASYGEISSIYMIEDVWGKGYGKAFLGWGMERLKELGYSNVSLWVLEENKRARNFYERFGFWRDGAEKTITRGTRLVQMRYIYSIDT
ncbi:GNAT family N-acetyltransferase [Paenibacillus mesophilus]|uniref:GNAT family N-acetyltransferase n=1 Tax=Paenibacillus mesophilus TaxID=2582849 RepID=UPI00110EEA11|nr:GNAT family N-acetyltransferase [Paenibacillus mesophilus]TMV53085.1 GNAT family N-acetyltransferase [Paenibacillus mesophilus]